MDKLYDLITDILDKPDLYIRRRSVQLLYAFIGGYLYRNEAVDTHCLDGFNEYIAERYGVQSDHNWADIIQFFSNSGHEEIELFKKHFKEFTRVKSTGDGLREP